MTIYLPESIALFRQVFDSVCQRILQCEKNAAFYELLVQLIGGVRDHPLLKEQLASLEAENQKQRQQFCTASLIAVEESWERLWKYHQKSFKSRKQLVEIKRTINAPTAISYSPLYDRLLFKLWEFCYHSSFFRCIREASNFFRAAQSELRYAKLRADHSKAGYFINLSFGLIRQPVA